MSKRTYIIIGIIAAAAILYYFYSKGTFSASKLNFSGPDFNATADDWFTEKEITNHINYLKYDPRGANWLNNIKDQAARTGRPLEAELRYRTVSHLRANKPK